MINKYFIKRVYLSLHDLGIYKIHSCRDLYCWEVHRSHSSSALNAYCKIMFSCFLHLFRNTVYKESPGRYYFCCDEKYGFGFKPLWIDWIATEVSSPYSPKNDLRLVLGCAGAVTIECNTSQYYILAWQNRYLSVTLEINNRNKKINDLIEWCHI